MAEITFTSKLRDDGSLIIPSEAVEELGLHPGDEVQVRVEATREAIPAHDEEQAMLQAKFDRFFKNLDTLPSEKPVRFSDGDAAEAAFAEAMDEKYRKLGFEP